PYALQFADDDLHDQPVAGQNRPQPLDRFQEFGKFIEDLLALQAGEPLQLHVEDGLRLDSGEAELDHQPVTCLGHRFGGTNQDDDGVEMVQRNSEAFENVIARLSLAQFEFSTAPNDVASEVDEALDQLEQVHHLRPTAEDREHDDAEAELQLGVLVKVVENDLRHFTASQFDYDAHALAVGFVAQVGDALYRLLPDQIRDPFDELCLVDLIGDFGDNDGLFVALLVGFEHRPGPHENGAATRRIRLHRSL